MYTGTAPSSMAWVWFTRMSFPEKNLSRMWVESWFATIKIKISHLLKDVLQLISCMSEEDHPLVWYPVHLGLPLTTVWWRKFNFLSLCPACGKDQWDYEVRHSGLHPMILHNHLLLHTTSLIVVKFCLYTWVSRQFWVSVVQNILSLATLVVKHICEYTSHKRARQPKKFDLPTLIIISDKMGVDKMEQK